MLLKPTFALISVQEQIPKDEKDISYWMETKNITSLQVSSGEHNIMLHHPCYVPEGLKVVVKPKAIETYQIGTPITESTINCYYHTKMKIII